MCRYLIMDSLPFVTCVLYLVIHAAVLIFTFNLIASTKQQCFVWIFAQVISLTDNQ